jgi:hypothetical protein
MVKTDTIVRLRSAMARILLDAWRSRGDGPGVGSAALLMAASDRTTRGPRTVRSSPVRGISDDRAATLAPTAGDRAKAHGYVPGIS